MNSQRCSKSTAILGNRGRKSSPSFKVTAKRWSSRRRLTRLYCVLALYGGSIGSVAQGITWQKLWWGVSTVERDITYVHGGHKAF